MNSKNNTSSIKKGKLICPCKLCPKNVTNNDNAILCDLCQTRIHIKCNHLNYMAYKYLQGCNESWYSLSCTSTLFPFGNLNNHNFLNFIALKPPTDLALLLINLIMPFLKTAVIQKM